MNVEKIYEKIIALPIQHQTQQRILGLVVWALFLMSASAVIGYFMASGIDWLLAALVFFFLIAFGLITVNLMLLSTRMAELVRSTAKVSPIDVAYKHITEAVKEAQNEVLIFTYFTYDPETGERSVDAKRMGSQRRRNLFAAFHSAIEKRRVTYTRIYQVDAETAARAREIVSSKDELYASEIKKIESSSTTENSHVMFVKPVTHLTFILVDDRNAFFDIEITSDANDKNVPSFSIFLRDADEQLIQNLRLIADKARSLS